MNPFEPTPTEIVNRISHLEVLRMNTDNPQTRKDIWETIQHLRSRINPLKIVA